MPKRGNELLISGKARTEELEAKLGRKVQWGEVVGGYVVFPCHEAQLDVLGSTARFTCGIAGTGGGKSVLIPLFFAKQLNKHPRGTFLLVIPHYKHLIQSGLYDRLYDTFRAFDPLVKPVKAGTSYDYFAFASGAKLFIRSAENPEAIEGIHANAVAVDEAAKVNLKTWRFTRARADGNNAPVLIVTTPDVNNWVYSECYKHFLAGDSNYYVRQWASSDRPGYSLEALESARKSMSAAEYDRRYGGKFAHLEGLVYETFADQVIDAPDDGSPLLPSVPVRFAGGIDWGWNDPLAVVVVAECQDGRLYVVEEYYGSHIPLETLTRKLKELERKWSKGQSKYSEVIEGGEWAGFFADHSRPEIKDLMRKSGVRIRDKRVSLIEAGITMVDTRLRHGYLKMFSHCERLLAEAANYQRTVDRDGDFKDKPVDKHNHCCDALRYVVTGLDYGRRLNFADTTDETAEEVERERLVTLNLLDGSDDQLKELEQKRENERLWQLAFGDLD